MHLAGNNQDIFMKKYFLMLVAMIVTMSLFAQNTSIQQGAIPSGGGADNVDSIYTLITAICAAVFLIVIIYALSRAVKALSSQVSS
jgi:preprotein translocase subunit SecG